MPVYNSFISSPRMAGLRIGGHHHHSKNSRTMTAIVDVEQSDMAPATRQHSSSSARSSRISLRSGGADPSLSMTIESPPLVCYGPPKESSGCLLSGLMYLSVEAPAGETFTSFTLQLEQTVTYKHPVVHNCPDCRSSTTVLETWNLISAPTRLPLGSNSFPFSHLFPGATPASCDNSLSRITYTLSAHAVTAEGSSTRFTRPITIERAILPTHDKHSIRIFPPTNLSASITHPSVIHPGGTFPFTLRLDGVLNRPKNTRWSLRKTTYRVEEHTKTISLPCAKHAPKLGGESKGVQHEDIRNVTHAEIKRGWKSDFETADGKIELEIMASVPPQMNAQGKLDAKSGIEVRHTLVVECIVAEEYMATTHSRGATPTGAARVLRMQFQMVMTARSGLGISWDEEAPPMYDDIPMGPPGYGLPPTYENTISRPGSISSIESL